MMQKHPAGVKTLISVELLLAAIAMPSGYALLSDPSGKIMGAQSILQSLTKALPFLKNFTVVGLFLTVVYGLLPILFSYGLWGQKKWAWTLITFGHNSNCVDFRRDYHI